jgi:hypothetical protein
MRWLATLGAQECAGLAAEDGAALNARAGGGGQRSAQGQGEPEGLVELGQTVPTRSLQDVGQDAQRARRCGRSWNDRQPNERLRRGDERLAAAGRTASNFIAIAYFRMSKLMHLSAHPFSPAAAK